MLGGQKFASDTAVQSAVRTGGFRGQKGPCPPHHPKMPKLPFLP